MENYSVRLPDDLAARLEAYADDRDITTSEAVRRLLLDSLSDDDIEERLTNLEQRIRRIEEELSE